MPEPRDADRGKRIKESRERPELDITQAEAARRVGVDTQTFSRWERGFPIKPRDVAALARVLGVPEAAIDPEAAKRLGENVPRGTPNDDTVGMGWSEVVETDAVEHWFNGFRDALRRLRVPADHRDRLVSSIRDVGVRHSEIFPPRQWSPALAVGLLEAISEVVLGALDPPPQAERDRPVGVMAKEHMVAVPKPEASGPEKPAKRERGAR